MFARLLSVRWMGVIGGMLCALAFAGVAADRSVASCSNEAFTGFRGFLAGCGAYERVSPPFKDGTRLESFAFSADGSRVVGESKGALAGIEGAGGLSTAFYQSVRSGSGWSTSAITPPSRLFPAQEYHDVSSDLTRSLWSVRSSSQSVATENLAVREPDGSFVEVGPIVPPEATSGPPAGEYQTFTYFPFREYAGGSSNLTRIFFWVGSGGPLWPEDTTNLGSSGESLYEYIGTGNTHPQLVGVDNEGRLISDCGTALGSIEGETQYSADVYNAVSNDGETVFFTASAAVCGAIHAPEVNEVYARVGHGAGATVAVSEPTATDCAACQTSTRAPAEFQGASADGSKVFFLSAQELFAGDTTVGLYEYDFGNRPGHKILRVAMGSKIPEVQGAARVSEDGSHVYFVAKGTLTEGPNAEGDEPIPGGENLYVFERDARYPVGHVTFIATLSEEDRSDWQLRDRRPVQATPDGRFFVFQSIADLTNGDNSAVAQVFEYDALREELVRVSVGEAGYAGGAANAEVHASRMPVQRFAGVQRAAAATSQSALSADGRVVVFQSEGGLTRQAVAAGEAEVQSVYEYRSTAALSDGQVSSVSNGDGGFRAVAKGLDATGGDVFFETADPALASDEDTQFDLYDARDIGGFPASLAVKDCVLDSSCQGGVGGAPSFTGVGSAELPGGGNLPAASAPPVVVKPPVTRAEKLVRALRVCRAGPRRKRHVCEARARRRYGASVKRKGKG